MKVAVSILSTPYSEKETIERINSTDADFLHIDVMDGSFVPEKSPKREFLYTSKKPLNVHLMVSRPFDYITQFALLNTESITIQCELEDDIKGLLSYIKSCGLKCGLAVSPETSLKKLEPYYEYLDEVLVLTVEPGKGGQKLLDSVLYKIDLLKKIREEGKYNFQIFADGGINGETAAKVKGADVIISGTFICNSENYQAQIDKLRL